MRVLLKSATLWGMNDVAKFPGLMTRKRSRNWYYRVRIPKDLRAKYEKTEIWESLGTEDRSEAERAWYEVSARIRDEFDQVRAGGVDSLDGPGPHGIARRARLRRARGASDSPPTTLRKLSKSLAENLARRWFKEELDRRMLVPPDHPQDAIADSRSLLSAWENPDDHGTLATTQGAANELVADFGFEGSVGDSHFDYLTELLRQGLVELETQKLEYLERGTSAAVRSTMFGMTTPLRDAYTNRPETIQPGSNKRVPYTSEELTTIFNAPIYTGCVDDEYGFNRVGEEKPRRGRFWLPLLGLYTGARAGELCQLRVEDFMVTDGGTPFIRICADEHWMTLKTRNAARDIPVHSELMKIGFQEFVDYLSSQGENRLFPEMIVEGKSPSYRFSKLYGTFRKSLDLKRTGLDFHSFRHTARQALRRVDVLNSAGSRVDEQIDEMFGWAEGKRMSSRYGASFPVDELARLMEQIHYAELDLSHLYPAV